MSYKQHTEIWKGLQVLLILCFHWYCHFLTSALLWIYWSQEFTALSEIQNTVYACQGGQKWRTGTGRHNLREALSFSIWKPISCCSENPVQQLGLLKLPQTLFLCTPSPLAVFGNHFFQHCYTISSYTVLEVHCPVTTSSAEACTYWGTSSSF